MIFIEESFKTKKNGQSDGKKRTRGKQQDIDA